MSNTLTGIALFAIIVALIAYLSSRSKAVDRVTQLAKDREDEAKAARDEADRRRLQFEADAKFWRELGEENLNKFADQQIEFCGDMLALLERHKPSSMEPFCGEGKKP